MARTKREKSVINQYLVNIALNDDVYIVSSDRKIFFETAIKYFQLGKIELYAYNFNETNFRFVLKDNDNLEKVIKQICISFSIYYNKKYSHTGKIFFDRFKSFASSDIMDTYNFMSALHRLDYVEKYNSSLNYLWNKYLSYSCILKQFLNKQMFKNFLKSLYYTEGVQSILIKVIGKKKFEKFATKLNEQKQEKKIKKEDKKTTIIKDVLRLKNFSTKNVDNSITAKYNDYVIKQKKQTAKKQVEKVKKFI